MFNFYFIVYALWLRVWALDPVYHATKSGFCLKYLNSMGLRFLICKNKINNSTYYWMINKVILIKH